MQTAFESPRNEMPPTTPPEGEATRRPELRAVTPEMSPMEAEGALKDTAELLKAEAANDTKEMTEGTSIIFEDLSKRNEAPMTADEVAKSEAIGERAKTLEQTLNAEVAAVTGETAPAVAGPDLRYIQGQTYRDELSYVTKELEKAERQKNGPLADALFARQRALLDSNEGSIEVPKEAPPATEKPAEAARDFATVEAEFRSLDQQIEAAYKKGDKSAMESLQARHQEVGAERKKMMETQKAAAEKAKAEQPSVAPAEAPAEAAPQAADVVQVVVDSPADAKKKIQEILEDKMRDLEAQRAALQGSEDTWAPDKKKAVEGQLEAVTAEWQDLQKEDEEEAEESAEPEKGPLEQTKEEMKRNRIIQLEAQMRELENKYKEASSPDEKTAIGRELEAATKEWDALRRAETGKGESGAVEQAAVLVAAAETLSEVEQKKEEDKTPEDKKKEADAKQAAATASPSSYASGSGGGDKNWSSEKANWEPPKKEKKEKGEGLGKKLSDAWDWAQKFFGGWTGIK